MGTRTLVTSLATFGKTVSGIDATHSYDLQDEPPKITREKLPCLIIGNVVLPGSAWRASTFMGNAPQHDFQVDHLLLLMEIGEKFQRKEALPALMDLHDAYLAAAKVQKFLNYQTDPVQQVVLNFKADYGDIGVGQGMFYGLIYSHSYTLNL